MSDPNEDLRAVVSALRSELDCVKSELRKLQKVIRIDDDEEDGNERVTVECNEVVIRPVEDPRFISMIIGGDGGGGISIIHWKEPHHFAVVLGVNEEGAPELLLQGPDHEPRVQLTMRDDRGLVAVLAGGRQAGAVMQAQPGGGSVAVLQPDGTARGVLMHTTMKTDGEEPGEPVTELVLMEKDGGRIKLRTDAGGALMTAGSQHQPGAVALSMRDETAMLMLKSAGNAHGAIIVTGPNAAQMSVFEGEVPGTGRSASLSTMSGSADLRLEGEGGVKAAELCTDSAHTGLSIWNRDGGETVHLLHMEGSHTQLSLRGTAEHKAVEILAMQGLSTFSLVSPTDPAVKLVHVINDRSISTAHLKGEQPIVLLGETEMGGNITVRGLTADTGQATLGGGHVAGGLVLAAGDGTVLLNLDATDHGGRLMMNNDLGFQRVLMGVYEESSSLLLNHTGQKGVSMMAGEGGGVVVVHDTDGGHRGSLPPLEEE